MVLLFSLKAMTFCGWKLLLFSAVAVNVSICNRRGPVFVHWKIYKFCSIMCEYPSVFANLVTIGI